MQSGLSATSSGGNAGSGHRARLLWRLLCVAYLFALIWLLLSMVPVELVRAAVTDHQWIQIILAVGHFACFLLLTLLVCASRWGVPRWTIVLGLAVFAVSSEPLQSQFSERLPEMVDCVQNLLGVACGCVLCWSVALARGSGR